MINEISNEIKNLTWREKFKFLVKKFDKITFSTSFSVEDQVILDFIAEENLPIEVFAIDTGRLPKETYDVWQNSLDKYKKKILAFYPDANLIANFVENKGINAFYESKELRLNCCEIRKVEPLKRALDGKNLWISGLRKEHSKNRLDKDFLEEDLGLNIVKFYPLLEVLEDDLWKLINDKKIPFNRLYKQGYKSIGCAPCSRAVKEGEDVRAGRWWWENSAGKECGLHA